MEKCKVCDCPTSTIFNIDFKATHICEHCARAIFLQQASWYANASPSQKISSEILQFTNNLEAEASLITEAVGDVMTIARLNPERDALKLIKDQFIVINREDLG